MKKLLTTFLLCHAFLLALAQSNRTELYIGLEPRFGKESWYEDEEWNINIAPFVFEYAISDHLGLRAKSSVFLHTGGSESNSISLTGAGLGTFYYLKDREEGKQYHGFFFGPWIELAYDHLDNMQHTTIAGEVGYSFFLKPRWTINLSSQLGYSMFSSEDFPGENHFGILFNIGYWVF